MLIFHKLQEIFRKEVWGRNMYKQLEYEMCVFRSVF